MEREPQKLSTFVYWILKIGIKTFHLIVHLLLSIKYCGKGKTVPPIQNKLLLKSATELAAQIRENKIKCEDVIRAYIDRIHEVDPYINAVVENRFHDALSEAKEIDKLVVSGKYTKQQLEDTYPLLGVPFTIKVLLTVKGMHSSASSKLFKDVIAGEDAPTVALLKSSGGIVLATTNSAEYGLGFDTVNPLYGKTCNPYNIHRTPGGSSGGESALLGAAGSVIGLGNDLLGSVRVPAHFTGVFSHKATLGMVSNVGSFPYPNPKASSYLYTGPMCRYSEDLVTMMKVLTSKNVDQIKFDRPVDFSRLKIYYQIDLNDPMVLPVDKEISDAMTKAMNHFSETYGITAKEVNIELLDWSNKIDIHLLLADMPSVVQQVTAGRIPHLNGPLELLKFFFGKSEYSLWTIVKAGFGRNPILFQQENVPMYKNALQELDDEFDKLLDENSVFLYPTLPVSAPYPYEMIPIYFSTVYTGIFNFLGMPATQCPLGLNKKGIPHGMQIVGRKNNDPLTLACAKELSKVFGGWISPS